MSKISGKDTKPEILVRKYLFSKGFRFRKNVKDLPGKPDIVLPKYKTIILSTDVSGTDTKIAKKRHCQRLMPNFGQKKYQVILIEIRDNRGNYKTKAIKY